MKLKQLFLPIACAAAMAAANAGAQSGDHPLNVVGYVNTIFQPGYNWFGNPLDDNTNDLNTVIPTAPSGTTVSLWNTTASHYTPVSTFNGSAWSTDLLLNPGTGALLQTGTQFTNTFVGQVEDLNGSVWNGSTFHQPPALSGPNGLYLLSSKAPLDLSGDTFGPTNISVFLGIIGRAPNNGEQIITLDPATQLYTTNTFSGGVWSLGDPTLGVGQAAMFNIGPVPEPGVVSIAVVGLVGVGVVMRRRRV
jgi:hypothetical protein